MTNKQRLGHSQLVQVSVLLEAALINCAVVGVTVEP